MRTMCPVCSLGIGYNNIYNITLGHFQAFRKGWGLAVVSAGGGGGHGGYPVVPNWGGGRGEEVGAPLQPLMAQVCVPNPNPSIQIPGSANGWIAY